MESDTVNDDPGPGNAIATDGPPGVDGDDVASEPEGQGTMGVSRGVSILTPLVLLGNLLQGVGVPRNDSGIHCLVVPWVMQSLGDIP